MKITPASKWREARTQGYEVQLPSGKVARIRPVGLDVMIQSGEIPDILSPLAAKSLWTETDTEEIAEKKDLAAGYTQLISLVCKASFLEPKIVDDPSGEDEITLADIDFSDKVAVFQLAIQPSEVLKEFRDQQKASLEAVPPSEDDGAETE